MATYTSIWKMEDESCTLRSNSSEHGWLTKGDDTGVFQGLHKHRVFILVDIWVSSSFCCFHMLCSEYGWFSSSIVHYMSEVKSIRK